MICEILSVGTELLMGQIANTDAQYLSTRLGELGIDLFRHVTVGDNPGRVKQALDEALSRSDMVITTGGLGPTEDDLTKEMVAEYFGLPMVLDQKSLDALTERMTHFHPGKPLTENNIKQAYFPEGAVLMPNRCGTAPGCIVSRNGKRVAVLPGPPRELKDMFEQQLEPYLRRETGAVIHSRFLKIFGVGESRVETMLLDLFHMGSPTLALYCGAGEVQARLTVKAKEGDDPAPLMDPMEAEIRRRLGDAVYAEGRDATMASTVLNALIERGQTLSLAESCTGGLLASAFVDCEGASKAFALSHVTYSNEAKARVLGVRESTLATEGAVSEACAREMAEGCLRVSGTDYALSVTGVAGPDGGTPDQPVGTVYIALASAQGTHAERFSFLGDRSWIRTLACVNALNMLRLELVKG